MSETAAPSPSGFARPIRDRWFEDYVPGIVVTCGAVAVTERAVLAFAREFDPQRIHTDAEYAARGPFGGLIASGWHTASMMMRVFVDEYLNDAASLASPGVDELRWTMPVRPGDVLAMRFTVVSARASRSKPDRGIVHTGVETLNQHGDVVMSAIAMGMVAKRPAAD